MDLDVTNTLREILEAHSVRVEPEDQALAAGRMTISAAIFRKPSTNISSLLQLDVNVRSPLIGARKLIESFAGWGSTEQDAINQAWDKFMRSSLHVLLEVFGGDGKGEDQIDWEDWKDHGLRWRACLGPLFTISFQDQCLPNLACGDLLDRLRDSLLPKLTNEYHWLRFYYMKQGESSVGSECLLDNESWNEGQNIVSQWSWPNGSYSVRHFLLLVPHMQP